MDQSNSELKNSKIVKILSWTLIIGSALILLKLLFIHNGYLGLFNKYQITKNFDPPLEYNFTYFLIFGVLEILLCISVFVSSTYVLKYNESWRKILIYSLAFSTIVLFVSPKLMLYPYLWSIVISLFLVFVIIKLSQNNIKVLFK